MCNYGNLFLVLLNLLYKSVLCFLFFSNPNYLLFLNLLYKSVLSFLFMSKLITSYIKVEHVSYEVTLRIFLVTYSLLFLSPEGTSTSRPNKRYEQIKEHCKIYVSLGMHQICPSQRRHVTACDSL